MAYVITDSCVKDLLCLDSCPSDAIHPRGDEADFEAAAQLFISPELCMDCGACVATCPTNSIFPLERTAGRKSGVRREERRALRIIVLVFLNLGARRGLLYADSSPTPQSPPPLIFQPIRTFRGPARGRRVPHVPP